METIFVKTKKGMDEMLARKPSIDAGLSSVLLLVDGVHTQQQLKDILQKCHLPADGLEILWHGGFIEPRVLNASTHKAMSEQDSRRALAEAEKDAHTTAFLDAYKYMVAETKARLGLRGFAFQLKLERAQNLDDLRSLLEPLGEAIARTQGLSVANEFMHDCANHLSAHEIRERSRRMVEEAIAVQNERPRLRRVA